MKRLTEPKRRSYRHVGGELPGRKDRRAALKLLKRLGIEPGRLIDQPLPRSAHVRAAEHRLRTMAVHRVADPP